METAIGLIMIAIYDLAIRLLPLGLILKLLGMFVICFAGYRIYRLFIYPYFVSPLRHLPGPKVKTLKKTSPGELLTVHAIKHRITTF